MANGNIEVTVKNSDEVYAALNHVPDFVHINMYYDSLAGIWIVTLDGRSGDCEASVVEINNMRNGKCLHELIMEAVEKYERKFCKKKEMEKRLEVTPIEIEMV